MIVQEILTFADIDKLTDEHMRRDHIPDERREETKSWMRTLLAAARSVTLTQPPEFALLGVMCADHICRVCTVDMQFISSALNNKLLPGQLPRTPYLRCLSWQEVLGMEVSSANLAEIDVHCFVDEILRWLADDFIPPERDCLDEEMYIRLKAELAPKFRHALNQHIREHRYTN